MKYKIGDKFKGSKIDGNMIIVNITIDNKYVLYDKSGFFMLPEECLDRDELLESTPTRWRAGFDKSYWWFDGKGEVMEDFDKYDCVDSAAYDFGNYFHTQEQAEQARDFFKAWRTLKDDTKGFVAEAHGDRGYEVVYNYDYNSLAADCYSTTGGGLRFATKEDAEASIENHRKEWLTFFGVKEEK